VQGDGIYVVDNDNKAKELVIKITFNSMRASVNGTTQEFTGVTFRGRLDTVTGTSIVLLGNTLPTIENVTGSSMARICNASGTMVQLSPRRNWLHK
jgi:hypothetical protein